jgi:glycosyltransferase involved in cell wall biosynthesis
MIQEERTGPNKPGLSIVVPVYNSQHSLEELCRRLNAVLEKTGSAYEIILVNDGSGDGSWQIIQSLTAKYQKIKGICLMRNYGQHNALLCGIRAARMEFVITLDDDLQNPPEEIPKLIHKIGEGFAVVYGSPKRTKQNLWRNIPAYIVKLSLQGMMGAETARQVSSFRIFKTYLREAFAYYQSSFVSIDVLLTWGTKNFGTIPVEHKAREIGKSQYTVYRLISHSLNMITGFSILPLQLATLIGFFFTVFGVGVLLYVLGRYCLSGGSVPGFPFLASLISIFAGAQLFSLGIIGEYIARMHFRVMNKPAYSIHDTISQEEIDT